MGKKTMNTAIMGLSVAVILLFAFGYASFRYVEMKNIAREECHTLNSADDALNSCGGIVERLMNHTVSIPRVTPLNCTKLGVE